MIVRTPVLDYGYVEVVGSWGSDEQIIEAARMSTGKGFNGWGGAIQCEYCGESSARPDADGFVACSASGAACSPQPIGPPGDEKLLRYLWENHHHTPFEMAGLTVEVQAPIFVFREWHRHRTQSYNEMSARYVPLPNVNYVPTTDRLLTNASTKNGQANKVSAAPALELGAALEYQKILADFYRDVEQFYQDSLAAGVPKELARLCLPVGRYSRMRASANLRNWLHFLELRQASNAQWEIRQYADAVGKIVAECFPRTHQLYLAGTVR